MKMRRWPQAGLWRSPICASSVKQLDFATADDIRDRLSAVGVTRELD